MIRYLSLGGPRRPRNVPVPERGKRFMSLVHRVQTASEAHPAFYLVARYQARFSWDESGCEMQLTTHQYHIPKLTVTYLLTYLLHGAESFLRS